MHEFAIAGAALDIVLEHAAGRRVAGVQMRIGHLRQVVPSALRFAFELAARETVAEGAALDIEEVPATGRCRACGTESALAGFPFACRACGGLEGIELLTGEELLVESLDLEEPTHTIGDGA